MRNLKSIPLAITLLAAAVVNPNRSAMAKGSFCSSCPVAGVVATATQSLGGVASTSGGCKIQRAANGMSLPDPKCTPGAFNPTVTPERFGSKNFKTACVRDCLTDGAQKKKMYANYNQAIDGSCELDHLVPLEVGGADSLDNIWPQCGSVPGGKNFKDVKDTVEQYLAIKVLQGMDINAARKGIATDWTQFIAEATKFCSTRKCDIQLFRK